MKLTKRLIALALSGVLMLGGLTACGEVEANLPEYDPATLDTSTVTDLTEFLIGVPGDTAVATLNGEKITADELVYWLVTYCDSLQQSAFQSGTLDIPWDADVGDGSTIEQLVREDALQLAVQQRLIAQMAEREGFVMTKEQLDTVQLLLDSIAAEGQQLPATLEEYLELSTGVGEEMFRWNWTCDYSYDALMQARFTGENAPAAEDILTWLEEDQGYYRVKHILIDTQNLTSEEEARGKHALAEQLLIQLLEAEDPIALFDELMLEYGEDPGVAQNPDGYVAYPGQMVSVFEQTAQALEPGSFSDVVTSEFGYHIILRLPLEEDTAQYEAAYINDAMGQLMAGWLDQADLEVTDFCSQVDVKEVYARISAYRTRFGQPPAEAAPAEESSSAADGSESAAE